MPSAMTFLYSLVHQPPARHVDAGSSVWHGTCEFLWRPGPWISGSSGDDDFNGFFTRALIRQDRGVDDFLSTINNNWLNVMMERQ